ncbi:MAG: 23S rRNA (adenine(1618)-N(6))-methyltransferase RlmF [Nibricoccus sp.]
MHPRNPHREAYDFLRLIQACPELKPFLRAHPLGGEAVDFADPEAVKTLNRALLKAHYGVEHWDIPAGYLCPPVPSRADYLHHVAELLAVDAGSVPLGPGVRAIDIGMGANCIYPILGTRIFGWSFVGSDVDPTAIKWAKQLLSANSMLTGKIECRLQPDARAIFRLVTRANERFALSLCNPPFHSSSAEAAAGSLRKLRNLGGGIKPSQPVLNFGGRPNELWCDGGEVRFIRQMIKESSENPELCVWFTTLVSKKGSVALIERELRRVRPVDVRTLTLFAGQKQSRVLAWTFLTALERRNRLRSVKS